MPVAESAARGRFARSIVSVRGDVVDGTEPTPSPAHRRRALAGYTPSCGSDG